MRIVIPGEPYVREPLRLPPQVFYVGDDARPDRVLRSLARAGTIDLCPMSDISEAESAVAAAIGQIILVVTANAGDTTRLVALAERIVVLNTSNHRHIHFLPLLAEIPDNGTIDRLEMLGVRVMLRNNAEMIDTYVRLLVWRISRPPSLPVPCFYLHYQDAESVSIFLLGPRGRAELRYGEKIGLLFEMLSVTHRWATTPQIASELEIGRSSVKVYLDRLRHEYERQRQVAGMDIPAKRVFCSELHNGVWIHRLRGRVLVID